MATPRANVIIPNWNGAHLLPTCLDALRAQSFGDFEAVVVDNGSTDGSRPLLAQAYPEVRVMLLPENRYFAGAVNRAITETSAPLVVLLNNDTEAEPAWLGRLVGALDAHPEAGMATSKLLLFDRRTVLHSAGDYYTLRGQPGNRGVWEEDQGQYDGDQMVFSACGGAAAYRRSMLEEIGLFDEDLVAYCEDVDLAFRAQLAGYTCVFVPEARVYHRLSATGGGTLASYYCGRNFIGVAAKNMPSSLLRRHWLRILRSQAAHVWGALRHVREPAARARLRGQLAGLVALPRMWRKRRAVFALQRVPDAYIESILLP
ncbi:MAG: glycosyltransferase family 2 protein [Chloroflexi bacterium]|nr:glycosyltransferase family 2 protein [Chloroflexota bacterium]